MLHLGETIVTVVRRVDVVKLVKLLISNLVAHDGNYFWKVVFMSPTKLKITGSK